MPQIQCLPPHVADLIAAGEVVERPASVVKELVENAIDAGSSAVTVELSRGGLTYIRITDNGCGIAPQQLPTAFLRHATSKLRSADDLAAIGTLGFRGEALAAIAAVSRVDIFSRQQGAEEGASLHIEGGAAEETQPAGCPEGTTICVRDLFYNTPARMKFMKKDSAEGAAASGIVQHLALSHPDVSFRLLRDGQEVLHTPGDGTLYSAVYAAMGRDFAMSLLPVSGSGGEVKAEGFVTKPLAGHGSRGKELFFVNGRFVKSPLLSAALEEAYKNQIMKGRFPGCVLHITLPTSMVDVNVHPAKTVVKFVAEKAVFDAVYYTVLDALNGEKNKNSADSALKTAGKVAISAGKAPDFYQKMTTQEFRQRAESPLPEKKPLGSFTVKSVSPAAPVDTGLPKSRPHSGETLFVRDAAAGEGPIVTASPLTGRTYEITPPAAQDVAKPVEKEEKLPETAPESAVAVEAEAQQTIEPQGEAPWRMVGEVLKTYIICEDAEENVWLIDKHAAHERLRFDALKAQTAPVMSQPLLLPVTVALEPEGYAAVLEDLALLQEFGFVCEDFGGGTVLLREIPADIPAEDAAATLEELAQKLALGQADPASARDELLHTMACKSAIKAGMDSDAAELAALVEKVQSGEIQYCPHGRPVKYRLRKYDIEKMFKRA